MARSTRRPAPAQSGFSRADPVSTELSWESECCNRSDAAKRCHRSTDISDSTEDELDRVVSGPIRASSPGLIRPSSASALPRQAQDHGEAASAQTPASRMIRSHHASRQSQSAVHGSPCLPCCGLRQDPMNSRYSTSSHRTSRPPGPSFGRPLSLMMNSPVFESTSIANSDADHEDVEGASCT